MSDAALVLATKQNTEAIKLQTSALKDQTKAIDALNANLAIYIRDMRMRGSTSLEQFVRAPTSVPPEQSPVVPPE